MKNWQKVPEMQNLHFASQELMGYVTNVVIKCDLASNKNLFYCWTSRMRGIKHKETESNRLFFNPFHPDCKTVLFNFLQIFRFIFQLLGPKYDCYVKSPMFYIKNNQSNTLEYKKYII